MLNAEKSRLLRWYSAAIHKDEWLRLLHSTQHSALSTQHSVIVATIYGLSEPAYTGADPAAACRPRSPGWRDDRPPRRRLRYAPRRVRGWPEVGVPNAVRHPCSDGFGHRRP